ncbi:hypothetical protein Sjap_014152 [Stephania japonica]|uniref:Uncharacterized protein n=1 Tax=Stephania japonica TaxID=461633 RepID=A0AAP0J028_9MAGN
MRFPMDEGIGPVNALRDRLRMYNALRSPISFGMVPTNELFDKSTEVKIVRIFTNSNSSPLIVIVTSSW